MDLDYEGGHITADAARGRLASTLLFTERHLTILRKAVNRIRTYVRLNFE